MSKTPAELAHLSAATQAWATWLDSHTPIAFPRPGSEQAVLGRAYRVAFETLCDLGDVPGLTFVSGNPGTYTFVEPGQ